MKPRATLPIVILSLLLTWLTFNSGFDLGDLFGFPSSALDWQREAIVGLWVDDANDANRLRLELIPSPYSKPNPIISVLDGRCTITGAFGIENSVGPWNYGSTNPLRLNVIVHDRGRILAVEFSDRDHVRLRLVDDIEAGMRPDALNDPSTLRFHRAQ